MHPHGDLSSFSEKIKTIRARTLTVPDQRHVLVVVGTSSNKICHAVMDNTFISPMNLYNTYTVPPGKAILHLDPVSRFGSQAGEISNERKKARAEVIINTVLK